MTGLDGYYYRRVLRGDEMVQFLVLNELELTAEVMLR